MIPAIRATAPTYFDPQSFRVGEFPVVGEGRFDGRLDGLYRLLRLWGEHQDGGVAEPAGHPCRERLIWVSYAD